MEQPETGRFYTGSANKIGLMSGVLLFLALILQSSIYTINYDEVGLKARLGTLEDIVSPGLHFMLPFGIEAIEKVPASMVMMEEFTFGQESENLVDKTQASGNSMITKDLNLVDTSMAVHYQIINPIAYVASVRDTKSFIRTTAEAFFRERIGQSQSNALFTTSGQKISNQIETSLQNYLNHFNVGVKVKNVEIREITPPDNVEFAFDKVNEAQQEKERNISEAKRLAAQQIAAAKIMANDIRTQAHTQALIKKTKANQELEEYIVYRDEYLHSPETIKNHLYVTSLAKVLPELKSLVVTPNNSSSLLPLFNLDSTNQGLQ